MLVHKEVIFTPLSRDKRTVNEKLVKGPVLLTHIGPEIILGLW